MDLIKFCRLSVFSPIALVASAFALPICVLTILLCTSTDEDETVNYQLTANVQDTFINSTTEIIIPTRFRSKLFSSWSSIFVETLAIFFMYIIDKIVPSPYKK